MEEKIYQIPIPDFKIPDMNIMHTPVYTIDDNPENFYNYEKNRFIYKNPFAGGYFLSQKSRSDFCCGKDINKDDLEEDPFGKNYIVRYIFNLDEMKSAVNKVIRNEEEDKEFFSIENINNTYFDDYIKASRSDHLTLTDMSDQYANVNNICYNKEKNAIVLCAISNNNKPLYNDIMHVLRQSVGHNYLFLLFNFKPYTELYKEFVYYILKYNVREEIEDDYIEETWDNLKIWIKLEKDFYQKTELSLANGNIFARYRLNTMMYLVDMVIKSINDKGDSNEERR